MGLHGSFRQMEDMAPHTQARPLARDLKLVFTDLELDPPQEEGPTLDFTLMFWPQQVFDAAVESNRLITRELIDVAQRNLNAHFSLLRRLSGVRNFGEVVELHAAHLSNQLGALIGQSEELASLSVKSTAEFVRGVFLSVAKVASGRSGGPSLVH